MCKPHLAGCPGGKLLSTYPLRVKVEHGKTRRHPKHIIWEPDLLSAVPIVWLQWIYIITDWNYWAKKHKFLSGSLGEIISEVISTSSPWFPISLWTGVSSHILVVDLVYLQLPLGMLSPSFQGTIFKLAYQLLFSEAISSIRLETFGWWEMC